MSIGLVSRALSLSPATLCIGRAFPLCTRSPARFYSGSQKNHVSSPATTVWQAVRLELGSHNPSGAIDIVNATLMSDPHVRTSGVFSTMKFNSSIRSRLPFHSLVHGLLRAGMPYAAAEQVHARLHEGAKIRMPTMNALIDHLLAAPGQPSAPEVALMGFSRSFTVNSARIQAELPNLAHGTRTAVQIVRTARYTRHNRDNRMYEKLIDACLLQGEIVVGCLLFVLLVRDWQLRRAIKSAATTPSSTPHDNTDIDGQPLQDAHIRAARQYGLDNWAVRIPQPKTYMMQKLLSHIIFPGASHSASFSPPPGWKPPDKQRVLDMKRAIFILAGLLDNRQLEIECLASLIKVMSNVPRDPPLHMSVVVDGSPALVDVYEFCHETIWRFSQSLPDRYVTPSIRAPSMIKPVSTRTYNVLLNYLLMHRMDVDAAHRLLQHMCTQRSPPCLPNVVTANTVMRRASLLRRNDIVDKVFQLFRTVPVDDPKLLAMLETLPDTASPVRRNPWKSSTSPSVDSRSKQRSTKLKEAALLKDGSRNRNTAEYDAPSTILTKADRQDVSDARAKRSALTQTNTSSSDLGSKKDRDGSQTPTHGFSHALEKLAVDEFNFPEVVELAAFRTADAHTISSYIAHLTSTNQIDRAIKLLYAIIPELQSRNYVDQSTRARLKAVRTRGALLGQYFFSTVINALSKAGRTGLAERVWYLAQLSEEASWDPDVSVSGGAAPWCLDITAYTAMLQCYAGESRKGLRIASAGSSTDNQFVVGWGYYNWLQGGSNVWDADDAAQASGHWSPYSRTRAIAARDLGTLLMRSMRERGTLVWRALEHRNTTTRLTAPRPDARFFNALLSIYGRTPGMLPRRARSHRQRSEINYRRTRRNQLLFGTQGAGQHDPALRTIAEEMSRSGFQLPLGLRHLIPDDRLDIARPPAERIRPRRFPVDRHRSFRRFSLEVSKDRGLPIAREPKRWQAVSDDWGKRFERQRTEQAERAAV